MRAVQRIALLIYIVSTTFLNTFSQDDSTGTIFIVENMPWFESEDPERAFSRFIQNNIKEKDKYIPDSLSGRIIIQFIVDSTGYIVEPNIIRGLSKELDSIACQIVLSSPKWTPGTQRGNPVRVLYTFPVNINMDPPVDQQKDQDPKKRKRKIKRKTTPNTV